VSFTPYLQYLFKDYFVKPFKMELAYDDSNSIGHKVAILVYVTHKAVKNKLGAIKLPAQRYGIGASLPSKPRILQERETNFSKRKTSLQ